ncbi:hypothetical protein F4779DRAFT_623202 [Xylariaceae sp. FL0662B]|nr:hypothetical protein F4779DRAFT_623202 [Xylariaceae sp. FL0662B]
MLDGINLPGARGSVEKFEDLLQNGCRIKIPGSSRERRLGTAAPEVSGLRRIWMLIWIVTKSKSTLNSTPTLTFPSAPNRAGLKLMSKSTQASGDARSTPNVLERDERTGQLGEDINSPKFLSLPVCANGRELPLLPPDVDGTGVETLLVLSQFHVEEPACRFVHPEVCTVSPLNGEVNHSYFCLAEPSSSIPVNRRRLVTILNPH